MKNYISEIKNRTFESNSRVDTKEEKISEH